jgi:hypothetical protein
MKLKETVYISLAAVAVIIGIHRSMMEDSVSAGVLYNYWLFMLGIIFLLLFRQEAQKRKIASQKEGGRPLRKAKKAVPRK